MSWSAAIALQMHAKINLAFNGLLVTSNIDSQLIIKYKCTMLEFDRKIHINLVTFANILKDSLR